MARRKELNFKPAPDTLVEYEGEYRSEEIEPVYRMIFRNNRLNLKCLKSNPVPLDPRRMIPAVRRSRESAG